MNPVNKIKEEKVTAVLRMTEELKLKDTVSALFEGGIKAVEIVIETPKTAELTAEIASEKERPVILAGGIITQRQAQAAVSIGADVIVSPIYSMNIARLCKSRKIPLIMTVSTPNEAYDAWLAGAQLIKISPASPMGGADYIEDILRPMKFLNIMAAGRITPADIPSYLRAGASAVCIGRAFYKDADFKEIKNRAEHACTLVKEFCTGVN